MPITSSAKKALRRDRRRTQHNKVVRSKLKTITDKITKSKDASLLFEAHSTIDRAAKKNIIHKNKAARLKSQLASVVEIKKPAKKTKTTKK